MSEFLRDSIMEKCRLARTLLCEIRSSWEIDSEIDLALEDTETELRRGKDTCTAQD